MRRAPIVLAGTVAGLIGVLEFHSTPAKVTLSPSASLPGASAGVGAPTANSTSPATGTGAASQPSRSASPQPSGIRTAVGPSVNYSFGILSVKVTVSGSKITNVGIASLDDSGNPRSQMIDQEAIPILEQETLQAQSASIQGVSGASYTSAGFAQSLQGALRSLGIT